MKKFGTYLMVFTLIWIFFAGTVLRQRQLSADVIRIHVLANSDSAEDQAVKLQVRDAVLSKVAEVTEGCADRKSAAAAMIAHAEELGSIAASTAGTSASVLLAPEVYETRRYGGFVLPAGEYLSLQIRLGEAAGKNWWCVAFPMVCLTATAEDFEAVAAAGGLDAEEIRLMTGDGMDVEVRFMVLEWLQQLKTRFFS